MFSIEIGRLDAILQGVGPEQFIGSEGINIRSIWWFYVTFEVVIKSSYLSYDLEFEYLHAYVNKEFLA